MYLCILQLPVLYYNNLIDEYGTCLRGPVAPKTSTTGGATGTWARLEEYLQLFQYGGKLDNVGCFG